MNRYSKDSYISIYVYESAQWALNSLNSWIERKLRQLQPRLCLYDNVFIQFRSLKQEIEIHIQMYPQFLCLWSRLSHLCNLSWVGIFLGRGGDNFRHRGLYHNAYPETIMTSYCPIIWPHPAADDLNNDLFQHPQWMLAESAIHRKTSIAVVYNFAILVSKYLGQVIDWGTIRISHIIKYHVM